LAQARQHHHAEAIATQAKDIVRTIPDPDRQARALAAIAKVLAQAERPQHAEALARTIRDEGCQALALAEVAIALVWAGEMRYAARVTAAVCATGTWQTAVTSVLLLAPSAFTTLTAALEEQSLARII
jgi:hypothetical protein